MVERELPTGSLAREVLALGFSPSWISPYLTLWGQSDPCWEIDDGIAFLLGEGLPYCAPGQVPCGGWVSQYWGSWLP